ncbi:hypothetical protein KKF91_02515 [Myxococcota bacterium]|nr:hypothetical protein [Myxococcota bacterium]MBU1429413.1 hypothetical protein [Myxococcota bacterium]MBU1897977.1 hypothetical protein [Myxococcota bacterium]
MSLLALILALSAPPPPPAIRAVAYAPHFEDAAHRQPEAMGRALDRVKALGATHLTLVVQWAQADVRASVIAPYDGGLSDEAARHVAAAAKARGLALFIFPIVNVQRQGPGEWRGRLAPTDRAAWWASYARFILHYADLASALDAPILSVGSELGAMEHERDRWLALIAQVRARFSGRLVYSANWDHFHEVRFWDGLDWMGLNAYFPLSDDPQPSAEALDGAWLLLRARLERWAAFHDRPFLFTEVGYRSVRGAATRPYHYETGAEVDLEAQARAWASFTRAWRGRPHLGGIVVWIWSEDGPTGYGLRDKPAEGIVRAFFTAPSTPPE